MEEELGHDLTCEVDSPRYIAWELSHWQGIASIGSTLWIRKRRRNGVDGGNAFYALYQANRGIDLAAKLQNRRLGISTFLTPEEFRDEMKG